MTPNLDSLNRGYESARRKRVSSRRKRTERLLRSPNSTEKMDPPSFQPFNPRSQLATYIRNLPHWRQLGASYFITFHLADSLPQAQLAQAKILRQQRDGVFSDPHASKHGSLSLEIQRKTEKWLDAGYGSCLLSRPKVLGATAAALTHFHDERYHLIAYVIMPNHCHVALQPRGDATLESIL